jgi:uncharacterized protein YyaL (SSP411 family)
MHPQSRGRLSVRRSPELVPGAFSLESMTAQLATDDVDLVHQALTRTQPVMDLYPPSFGQWLQALAYALSKPREIAPVGDPDSTDTHALLNVARNGYRPFQVMDLAAPDAQPPTVPLLQDRGLVKGQAAAYVCRNFACQAPVTDPSVLQSLPETR